MPYCTQADLINQIPETYLIELTDDAEAGTIDSDKVTRAIVDADDEINLYCRKYYTVPFTTVAGIIRKFSVDIAIYNLYSRRRSIPEERVTRYADAITTLKSIAAGEFFIVEGEIGPDSADIDVQPEFTKSKLDHDDEILGRVMGRWDEEEGSLDDW